VYESESMSATTTDALWNATSGKGMVQPSEIISRATQGRFLTLIEIKQGSIRRVAHTPSF
jgi:hypothetical protein